MAVALGTDTETGHGPAECQGLRPFVALDSSPCPAPVMPDPVRSEPANLLRMVLPLGLASLPLPLLLVLFSPATALRLQAQPLPPDGGRAGAPSVATPTPTGGGTGAPPTTPGATPALSGKELEVLERIRRLKVPRWRVFGACRYDWSAWRLTGGGVRMTSVECGEAPLRGHVVVHCETLRISRRVVASDWEAWRLPLATQESPTIGGEDLMMAALCANVRPLPQPTASPKTTAPTLAPPARTIPVRPGSG